MTKVIWITPEEEKEYNVLDTRAHSPMFRGILAELASKTQHFQPLFDNKTQLGFGARNGWPCLFIYQDGVPLVLFQQTPCGRVGVVNLKTSEAMVWQHDFTFAYLWDILETWGV